MVNQQVFIKLHGGWITTASKMRCDGGAQSVKWNNTLHHGEQNATLHHMIPWEALGRVLAIGVNSVSTGGSDDVLTEILNVSQKPALRANLVRLKGALTGLAAAPAGSAPNKAKKITVSVSDGFESSNDAIAPASGAEDVVNLVHHWCWMPGNLFTGSSNRGDDPGYWGFDFPPADAYRMDQRRVVGLFEGNGLSDADVVNKADFTLRYQALYAFWRLINTSTDDELKGSQRGALLGALRGLAAYELWRPLRLIVAKSAQFQFRNGSPFKLRPAAIDADMKEEQKVHRAIQAVKNNHAQWSKTNRNNSYVKAATKDVSVEE
ncbi:hypothetical protein D7Y13_04335 [Corallococcus praedator]|uniref:Uncharacterized protein n=1 Tax=Corallococcus praedator TaxID=2316724 RepID=A0ABX9QPS4_9BACT|nr:MULTISPECIES: hypothetical protein [Corallococcus]RKH35768.1 hypothetical protein D7X75_03175 [Corallococcus sp. CA031C]RKI15414.1 hypothetical protein D7Y13_04335 [Corallococcus praedator]